MSDLLLAAASNLRRWRAQPDNFVREVFKVEPDEWQQDALAAVGDPLTLRLALQACAGPGKTAVLAWIAWWFLACFAAAGQHPNGAATSVTSDNLHDNLWKELAKWQARSPMLLEAFEITSERVFAKDHEKTWFLSARSWPKTANPDEQGKTLSGIHSDYVLFLIDESGAIPTTVLRAAEQGLSSCKRGLIVQAGNPISLEGMLYAASSSLAHQWRIVRITGDPDDPKRSPRISLEWAQQQIATYGRENPWVMSYILGKFPPASINSLLGVDEVRDAMQRELPADAYTWAQKRLGIDVARFGDDRTVLFPRQGLAAFNPVEMRHNRGTSQPAVEVANRAMGAVLKWGAERLLIDGTGGWAAGAIDILRAAGHDPVDVQFSAPGIDPRYENRRAEIWFNGAEWVKRGGSLPPLGERFVQELTTTTYSFSKSGKFLLEPKDQVKKRLGRSPDLADALMVTFGEPEAPRSSSDVRGYRQAGRAATEWNPYEDRAPVGRAETEFDPYATRI